MLPAEFNSSLNHFLLHTTSFLCSLETEKKVQKMFFSVTQCIYTQTSSYFLRLISQNRCSRKKINQCFRHRQGYTGAGITQANEMNSGVNHAPGAGSITESIARPVDLSICSPACHHCATVAPYCCTTNTADLSHRAHMDFMSNGLFSLIECPIDQRAPDYLLGVISLSVTDQHLGSPPMLLVYTKSGRDSLLQRGYLDLVCDPPSDTPMLEPYPDLPHPLPNYALCYQTTDSITVIYCIS